MEQFISTKVLIVNGTPAVCECHDNVVCSLCVQANLILWEREEHAEEARAEKLCREIKDYGVRRLAKNLNIPHTTVAGWLKSGRVKSSYLPFVTVLVEGGEYNRLSPIW